MGRRGRQHGVGPFFLFFFLFLPRKSLSVCCLVLDPFCLRCLLCVCVCALPFECVIGIPSDLLTRRLKVVKKLRIEELKEKTAGSPFNFFFFFSLRRRRSFGIDLLLPLLPLLLLLLYIHIYPSSIYILYLFLLFSNQLIYTFNLQVAIVIHPPHHHLSSPYSHFG